MDKCVYVCGLKLGHLYNLVPQLDEECLCSGGSRARDSLHCLSLYLDHCSIETIYIQSKKMGRGTHQSWLMNNW